MKITYIGHSGFLVELEKMVLLFDYFQGEIPQISGEKKWFVFASHRHQDHFQPKIFQLAGKYPHLQYILSSDIPKNHVPETQQIQTIWLKPEEHWENPQERLYVETLRSTDEGAAFLVKAEGQTLYHAGDLNNWYWDEEPESWNGEMAENYREFIEPLRGKTLDAAFVVLDPRQDAHYLLGMDYFLELTETKKIYPMHCWEDYSIIDRWISDHPDNPYRSHMVKITKRGECFFQ